jgi:hypothetical protein
LEKITSDFTKFRDAVDHQFNNQKIMNLIAWKQDQGLEQLTVEQLQALLDQA